MNMDQIFCANQIVIPPTLPSILKKYAKAAIRTQPYDLLVWSAAYFKAMSTGSTPPVKMRLEFPIPEHRQLSLGYIKLLVYQFGRDKIVPRDELTEKWNDVCLPYDTLNNILRLGSFAHSVNWNNFIAIALGFLEESLKGTMMRICEVLTDEPEGGSAMIPLDLFVSLYRYLGEMDCGIVEIKEKPFEFVEQTKQPCLPQEAFEPDNISSDKDIDSVIREVGEAESRASIETTLEGKGAELDWPNIESRSDSDAGEVRFSSEASDAGATSKYGIEVMEPEHDLESLILEQEDENEGDIIKEDKELDLDLVEERRQEEEVIGADIVEQREETIVVRMEEKSLIAQEFMSSSQAARTDYDSESEEGSMKILMDEKDSSSQDQSLKDSQFSDPKHSIENLDKDTLDRETSLVELRPTVDRELRQKLIEQELEDQEARQQKRNEEEALKVERRRVEEEAKEKFHMHVPGIGPTLPTELMNKAQEYLLCCAQRQSNMVMPRNLRHFLCPPLDLQSEERIEGLDKVLNKVQEEYMAVAKERDLMKTSMIELVKSEDIVSVDSTKDTSMSDDSTLSSRPMLGSASTQALGLGATSLLQLIMIDK